jgi:hypothetical protein
MIMTTANRMSKAKRNTKSNRQKVNFARNYQTHAFNVSNGNLNESEERNESEKMACVDGTKSITNHSSSQMNAIWW